jgi:hypothetical protein
VLSRMYVESWWQSIVLEGRYLPSSRSSENYGRHFQDLATSQWCRRVLRISSIGSGCDAGWQEAFLQAITAIAEVQLITIIYYRYQTKTLLCSLSRASECPCLPLSTEITSPPTLSLSFPVKLNYRDTSKLNNRASRLDRSSNTSTHRPHVIVPVSSFPSPSAAHGPIYPPLPSGSSPGDTAATPAPYSPAPAQYNLIPSAAPFQDVQLQPFQPPILIPSATHFLNTGAGSSSDASKPLTT